MTTTVLTSIPCPTEDMAKNSLSGAIAEFGKNGHKVSVLETTTLEMETGWIATISIEIEDIEEEEEQKPEDRKSEAREAEDIIEKENELFYLTHLDRPSQAERAFPDGGEPPSADEIVGTDTTPRPSDDTIGVDQNPAELSDVFESDFSHAMTPEPPPPGTPIDSALIYPVAAPPPPETIPVSEMSVEELEQEVERRRQKEKEALAAAMAVENGEEPAPTPQE